MAKQNKHYLGAPLDEERLRYEEVKFYLYIKQILKLITTPQVAMQTINAVAKTKQTHYILEPVIQKILCNDFSVVPTKEESAVLMYKHQVTVRLIMETLQIQQEELYSYIDKQRRDPINIHRKLNEERLDAVKVFNSNIEQLGLFFRIGGKV